MTSWEAMWQNLPRGSAFDCDGPSKTLVAWLKKREKKFAPQSVLIPGAGRAYDAVALAKHSSKVTTLDIAPTACIEAKKLISEAPTSIAKKISIEEGDFFNYEFKTKFDFVWDCTFLCALPREKREAWAKRYNEIIQSGGRMLCLVFPIVPEGHAMRSSHRKHPPYHLDCDVVEKLLKKFGFSVIEKIDPIPENEKHMPGALKERCPDSAIILFHKN